VRSAGGVQIWRSAVKINAAQFGLPPTHTGMARERLPPRPLFGRFLHWLSAEHHRSPPARLLKTRRSHGKNALINLSNVRQAADAEVEGIERQDHRHRGGWDAAPKADREPRWGKRWVAGTPTIPLLDAI
jgi:hypothetical protein